MSTHEAWRDQARDAGRFGHRLHPEAEIELDAVDPYDAEHLDATLRRAISDGFVRRWSESRDIDPSTVAAYAAYSDRPTSLPAYVRNDLRERRKGITPLAGGASCPKVAQLAQRVLAAGGPTWMSELDRSPGPAVSSSRFAGDPGALFYEEADGALVAEVNRNRLSSVDFDSDAQMMRRVDDAITAASVRNTLGRVQDSHHRHQRGDELAIDPVRQVSIDGEQVTVSALMPTNDGAEVVQIAQHLGGSPASITTPGSPPRTISPGTATPREKELLLASDRAAKIAGAHQLMAPRCASSHRHTLAQTQERTSGLLVGLEAARLQTSDYDTKVRLHRDFAADSAEGRSVLTCATSSHVVRIEVAPTGGISGSVWQGSSLCEFPIEQVPSSARKARKLLGFVRTHLDDFTALAEAADDGFIEL